MIETYKKLQECFTSKESTYTDKAKTFRTIYEQFANGMIPQMRPRTPLGTKLRELFKRYSGENVEQIEEASTILLNRLNIVVHENKPVTAEELSDYYKMLLLIIKLLTGEEPDDKSLLLAGLNTDVIINGLNNEQKNAVLDDAQFINVNAGPGTGKTHLLVRKLLYYLRENEDRKIVALSFTNSAAHQLKDRVLSILSDACFMECNPKNCITSTIHSFCYSLISQYSESKGEVLEYEILDDSVIDDIAADIATQYNLVGVLEQIKGCLLNGGVGNISKYVNEYKAKHHFIRVEEILDIFIEKTDSDISFTEWLQGKVDCLLVDEAQDLSFKVYRIFRILHALNPQINMFFVGDPRQNIFAFNGGDYTNYKKFVEDLQITPSQHVLHLTYRCPKGVVELVNQLNFMDCSNEKLIPVVADNGGIKKLIPCYDENTEAKEIVTIIQRTKSNNAQADICVMSSGLWYLEKTAKELNLRGIPFEVKGGQSHLSKIIMLVNHCLRIIDNNNESSRKAICRMSFINNSNGIIEELQEISKSIKDTQSIVCNSIIAIKESLIKQVNLTEEALRLIEKYSSLADNNEYDSINKFLFACTAHRNDTFLEFYEKDFNVECTSSGKDNVSSITLSTIHSAKGLEWNNVILAGMADKIMPNYRCYSDENISIMQKMINDEKKKYYVAATRSKKNIWITYPTTFTSKYGKTYPRSRSPFLL